ncbi:hypothetical protein [Derxia lacustris]|uniref:hypothetical protein n=1 Tax=Derxia lacustris TaxID=764842 RepID=UPI00111C1AC5|nr:hypothetical protein [Derxia lacustris]
MKPFRILLAVAALAVSFGIAAANRRIPDDARRARVAPADISHLAVYGTAVRLAPGARILDRNNRFVTPSSVPANSVARLRLGSDSAISDVWLLTDEEIAQSDPLPAWPQP